MHTISCTCLTYENKYSDEKKKKATVCVFFFCRIILGCFPLNAQRFTLNGARFENIWPKPWRKNKNQTKLKRQNKIQNNKPIKQHDRSNKIFHTSLWFIFSSFISMHMSVIYSLAGWQAGRQSGSQANESIYPMICGTLIYRLKTPMMPRMVDDFSIFSFFLP